MSGKKTADNQNHIGAKSRMKTGIMGGTFNPVHYGHLIIAENACCQYGLDRVIFVPTGHPPHKEFLGDDMCVHRCRMTELAIEGNDHFAMSYMEVESTGINYTYLSLKRFHEKYPDDILYFIMGADSLFELKNWVRPELIIQNAVILAAVREKMDSESVDRQIEELRKSFGGEIHRLDTPNFDVSSKLIRKRVKDGQTIKYMTPEAVEDYIKENKLYL